MMVDIPIEDAAPPCVAPNTLGSPITNAVGGAGVALAIGKFDTGQTIDLAVSITTDTAILAGNGAGTFTASQMLGTPSIAVVAEDFDITGIRDDLVLLSAGAVVAKQQNETMIGTFDADQPLTGPFTNASNIGVAEFGGNLVADVAITDDAGLTPFISLASPGTFSRGTSVGATGDKLVLVRQIDKASDADAVLVDAAGNVKLALSDGSDEFAAPVTIATGAIGGIAVGNFSDDTFLDLIVVTANGGTVFVQDSANPGTFTMGSSFTEVQGVALAVGDVNADGLDDVLTPTAVVLQCPTTHALTQRELIDAAPPAVLVDVTGDSKVDLLRLSGTDLIVRVQ